MGLFSRSLGAQFSAVNPLVCCFTSNGTWTLPGSALCIEVWAVGAGGQGGDGGPIPDLSPDSASLGGQGGGGGGISCCKITSGIPSSACVIVGTGDSCFGSLVIGKKGATGVNGYQTVSGANLGCAAGGTGNYATGGYGGCTCTTNGQSTAGAGQTISGSTPGGGAGGSTYRLYPSGTYYASNGGAGGSASCICPPGLTFGAAGQGGNGTSSAGVPGRITNSPTCSGLPYGAGGGGGGAGTPFSCTPINSIGCPGGGGIVMVRAWF